MSLLPNRVVIEGKSLVENVITVVDRPFFKKWVVVAESGWQAVELTAEHGWRCKCHMVATLCPHVVAAGLAWMKHHGMEPGEVDDKTVLEAVRLLKRERKADDDHL